MENEKLLIDPHSPAYEAARSEMVEVLRQIGREDSRNGYTQMADDLAVGDLMEVPTWIALALMATRAPADLLEKPGEPLDVCFRCTGSGVGVADTVCTICNGSGGLDVIDLEALTYDELWDAIAAATRIDGGIVAISVVKFREAIRAIAPTTGDQS